MSSAHSRRSDLDRRLLASVSRSFYLSLRFVPGGFRGGVSAGYLLARATDTVADTACLPGEDRLACLELMEEVICGRGGEAARRKLAGVLKEGWVRSQDHPGERELLSRFSEVLAFYESLPAGEAALVRRVLEKIIRGQRLDVLRFDCSSPFDTVATAGGGRGLPDERALLEYTYLVAGCVGEFWTELMYEVYGDFCCRRSREEMLLLGRHYGQALQLVNILRDESEDASRGRRYLPPCGGAVLPAEFRKVHGLRALEWLTEGMEYAGALSSARLRFGTGLPALIGVRTLELLDSASPEDGGRKVKVPRREVYGLLWQAVMASFTPGGWEGIAGKCRGGAD